MSDAAGWVTHDFKMRRPSPAGDEGRKRLRSASAD